MVPRSVPKAILEEGRVKGQRGTKNYKPLGCHLGDCSRGATADTF